jgi:ABC-type multidrug transport system fused ATPase/permease subunit
MSEKILNALMELFAIIASPDSNGKDRRTVVHSFLERQLNFDLVKDYITLFDSYYSKHQMLQNERGTKRIGADSVKVLRICNDINKELAQKQKVIVLVQLFEFVKSDGNEVTDQEFAFINAVAESFYIPKEEYELIRDFTLNSFQEVPNNKSLLLIDSQKNPPASDTKHIFSEYLTGKIWIIHVSSASMYFLRYRGESELYLNGQILQEDKVYVLNTGTSIRNHHVKPLYFSDLVSAFKDDQELPVIVFEAEDVTYLFKNGKNGLFKINFSEESGRLVGIMGSSGAGKSTLLNILNGSMKPTEGRVLINGIDIHKEGD